MRPIPVSLARDPIVEAICELRFDGASKSVAPLLVGALFSKFRSEFPSHVSLPTAMLPDVVRDMQPDLRYQIIHRLESKPPGRFIGVGDHTVVVSVLRPYCGWKEFKPLILSVFGEALETGLVGKTNRLSIKYANVLEEVEGQSLSDMLKFRLELGDDKASLGPVQVRRHVEVEDATVITQITTPAVIRLPNSPQDIKGTAVEVDVIRISEAADLSPDLEAHIEQLHSLEKKMFFGLLTESTEKRYDPQF